MSSFLESAWSALVTEERFRSHPCQVLEDVSVVIPPQAMRLVT